MFSILFVCFEGVYLLCDMSFTRCVSQFDILPLNPDTSPEEETPNRLFILTIEPVFQVDMLPLKDFVPLNTG